MYHMYVHGHHNYYYIIVILGLLVLHERSSTLDPEQLFPPQEGAGLSHFLVQFIVPLPHVLLHGPHVHGLHPPSTTMIINMLQVQRN